MGSVQSKHEYSIAVGVYYDLQYIYPIGALRHQGTYRRGSYSYSDRSQGMNCLLLATRRFYSSSSSSTELTLFVLTNPFLSLATPIYCSLDVVWLSLDPLTTSLPLHEPRLEHRFKSVLVLLSARSEREFHSHDSIEVGMLKHTSTIKVQHTYSKSQIIITASSLVVGFEYLCLATLSLSLTYFVLSPAMHCMPVD